jgi:hypothetical protein
MLPALNALADCYVASGLAVAATLYLDASTPLNALAGC